MNYWIFNATNHKNGEESLSGRDVYRIRMGDRFWGLGAPTANRKRLAPGDRVVFYIGQPEMAFAGTATLASASFDLSPDRKAEFSHDSDFFTTDHGVELTDIDAWAVVQPMPPLAPSLDFVEDSNRWGVYLQGGTRQISEDDFQRIVSMTVPPEAPAEPVQSEAESFALETHLEDFMERNWPMIDWGAQLDLYQDEDTSGRQFPAGLWSIDFLAVDQDTGDLVVIELKRGRTSDSTVGQVLRYMSWVRENLAAEGQAVRGLIVAREIDDALRYAVRGLVAVEVKTYSVSFSLSHALQE